MNIEIEASINKFKTQFQNREEAAKQLIPLLKPGTNVREVTAILGAPDGMDWQYTLFYSSSMSVRFGGDNKVMGVESDFIPEVDFKAASGLDRKAPKIEAASSRFKDQPYNRHEPAKELIPIIKLGMSAKDVEDLLGAPDAKHWEYLLVLGGTSTLTVGFDTAGDVTQAAIVTQ